MINFENLSQQPPFLLFKEKYDEAIVRGQKNIEAISISSYNTKIKEVDSRFVNLKFIANDEFIFFTNYKSPKASAFYSHKQIAALVYWPSINVQIRMKAKIKQTTHQYNQKYFIDRSLKKNALAISSNQSEPISSYEKVKDNFNKSLQNDDLRTCPDYWGGYAFIPFYFEFWKGNESRLNKREVFEKKCEKWNHFFLQP